MSVKKILPIARKMGTENFLAYKEFAKKSKLYDGKQYSTTLNLTGINIMDTVNITVKGNEELPKGFRELLKEIYKKYFPRSASQDAQKTVVLSSKRNSKDSYEMSILTMTTDKDGQFADGMYSVKKEKNEITTNISTFCEDVLFRLSAILKLPKNNSKAKHDIDLKLTSLNRNLIFEQEAEKTKISISPNPTNEIPYLGIQMELPNKMLESMFGGEFEESLPDLIKKSGFEV